MKWQFIKNISYSFLQQFLVQFVAFLLFIVLARLIIPSDFGLYAIVIILVQIGQVFVDMGISQSLIRNQISNIDELSSCFFFSILLGCFYYTLIYFVSPAIGYFFDSSILAGLIRVQSLSVIVYSVSNFLTTILTIRQRFKDQLILSLPSIIFSSIISIYLARNNYGVWSLTAYTVLQALFFCIFIIVKTNWKPSFVFQSNLIKSHISFGKNITISGIIDIVFQNINQVFLGKFYPKDILGFYTRADSLKQLPVSNFAFAINKVSFPLLSKHLNEPQKFQHIFSVINKVSFFLILPFIGFSIVYAKLLFVFLFSDIWLPSVPYFQILSIGAILFPSHVINLNVLNIKGRSDLFLKLEFIKKLLFLVLVLIALKFGIMGLVWVQTIYSFIAFFINSYYSKLLINYSSIEQIIDFLKPLLISIVLFCILYLIDNYTFMTNNFIWIRLLFGFFISFAFYIIFAYILKTEALIYIINLLKRNNDQRN